MLEKYNGGKKTVVAGDIIQIGKFLAKTSFFHQKSVLNMRRLVKNYESLEAARAHQGINLAVSAFSNIIFKSACPSFFLSLRKAGNFALR